uniref:Uncharacterized protein n=1 Tax=Arundo donax TaxID=35708 RepID=A0A0A8ZMV8_ARUDO
MPLNKQPATLCTITGTKRKGQKTKKKKNATLGCPCRYAWLSG